MKYYTNRMYGMDLKIIQQWFYTENYDQEIVIDWK